MIVQPTDSEPDQSAPIQIAPITAAIPTGVPTNVVLLEAGVAVPKPILDDRDWPRVRGYELLTVIGSGGMGIVYMARQCDLQRTVALKMLRGLGQFDTEYRTRLQVEAETVAKLQHPNIIQVFEIGTVEPEPGELHPSPFISFEFVNGGSLMQRTEAPQPPQYAAQVIEKIARAVHAAHRLGVIHRDLKPANVLLTREGEPKVADFGLAKHFGDELDSAGRFLTRAGVVMGTPAYMAPEQAAGENITPSIDIYALGVILYELLTARVPFQGATPVETMCLVRDQEPVSPRQLQPKLSRDLETICLKCLQKEPANRYATTEALADDLARWREGRPILARPVGPVERTLRMARRNPAVAALSLSVVFVSLVGVCGVAWKWQEAIVNAEQARSNADQARINAEQANLARVTALASARSERWERYRSNIAAAASALQLNNIPAARQSLEAAPEEHRGWEWRHFSTQLDGAQHVLRWPDVIHASHSFSPDGSIVLVGQAYQSRVRAWDIRSRQELWTTKDSRKPGIRGDYNGGPLFDLDPDAIRLMDLASNKVTTTLYLPKQDVFSIDVCRDGKRVVTAGKDGNLRVWDGMTGVQLRSIPVDDTAFYCSAISDDGKRFAVCFERTPKQLTIWDLDTGKQVQTESKGVSVLGCSFTPTGDRLVTTDAFPSNTIRVWDATTGKFLVAMSGHHNQIMCLAFNNDATRIVSASLDQTARVWELSTGKVLHVLSGHRDWLNSVHFSADGKRIVTASQDATLRLWDAQTGANLAILQGHSGAVIGVRYNSSGEIVSVGVDGTVRIWDPIAVERAGSMLGHTNFVYGVAFHPDGEHVASVSWDGTIRLWEATTGRQNWSRKLPESYGISVSFHPDGKHLAASSRSLNGSGRVQLLTVENGHEVHGWSLPLRWADTRLSFNRQGGLLAIGTLDKGVRIWNTETRKEVMSLSTTSHSVLDVSFSPDNRWLAAAHMDGPTSFRIWDLTTKTQVHVLQGHTDHGHAVTFSPDGKILATAASDNTVRLWDTMSWKEIASLKHGTKVHKMVFTPDSERLACGCADSTIRLWDMASNQEVAELRKHTSYVHSLAFSPDGSRLASGSGDSTIRVWDTKPVNNRVPR
ncbi:MAG: hypothetical protein C0467_29815 [Planctomycetaceae bacterium]|nr:hypothetical protein [Planctomycetaceae bacterium]